MTDNFLLTAGEYVKQPAEPDDGGCFEPSISDVAVSPAPKPAPKPKPGSFMTVIDDLLRENGRVSTPAPETGVPTSDEAVGADTPESAPPTSIPAAPVAVPSPPHRVATAPELFTWIKRSLLAETHLSDHAAESVTYWVISTWFQDQLTVLPCLVITGSAHDARRVLAVLNKFCPRAPLLAGFRRSHLRALRGSCQTYLISERNLDERTAHLLGNLTDPAYRVADGSSFACYSKSTAVYAGENPEPPKIQNSIHIHIPPASAAPTVSPFWLQKTIECVPVHLNQYREKILREIRRWTWVPSGLSPEMATIATELGRCIVDAPELRQKLVILLKTQDNQRLSDMSNTTEAIILEATRALSGKGLEHAYAHEIAAEANRLLGARGEVARLRPENIGHRLKKLGLRTRRLSKIGNGLAFDRSTLTRIQELATLYAMEDSPAETENLHESQATQNKGAMEVMEVVEVSGSGISD